MSCDRGGAPKSRLDRLMENDSIPATVKQLVRSVADGDSIQFARLVSYPLKRPYPLHDIENADQMAHYYREMVDDSLRNAILESSPEDWGEYGWRGWSVNFVLPGVSIMVQISMLIISKLQKHSAKEYMIYYFMASAYGLILPFILLATGVVSVSFVSALCIGISFLFMAALPIFKGKEFKEEMHKKFHI